MDEIEDMDHLWRCPAFNKERTVLRESMKKKLSEWKLPFAEKTFCSRREKFQAKLFERAKKEFPLASSDVIRQLCAGFIDANLLKPEISLSSFFPLLRLVFPQCECPHLHVCGRQNIFALQPELNELLAKELSLSLEANTSSLGHSSIFIKWCSPFPVDKQFGSLGTFRDTELAGKNSIMVVNQDEKSDLPFTEVRDYIDNCIKSCKPSRILLACPSPQTSSIPNRTFITIASIPTDFPLILSERTPLRQIRLMRPFSIILASNKESLVYDPINWHQLKRGLLDWGAMYCPSLFIPQETDNLFCERTPFHHSPRISMLPPLPNQDIYHFFDPEAPRVTETNFLMDLGIPLDIARKINKINSHPRGLSLIGILPNQLRQLLKQSGQDVDDAFNNISMELFWFGFTIWSQRNKCNDYFWKKIAPDEWKVSPTKTVGRPAKNKVELKQFADKCRNPFHFLKKRQNLSHIMPTPCGCYKSVTHSANFVDISSFRIPVVSSLSLHDIDCYKTREDLIRGAHDRSRISAI